MRLNQKLILGFATIAILIGIAGYLGSSELASLGLLYYQQENEQIPAISSLAEMKAILPIIELEPSEYIIKPDIEHIEELDEAEETMYSSIMTFGSVVGEEKAASMKGDVDELFALSREVIALKDNGQTEAVLEQKFAELDDKLDIFDEKLDFEVDRISQELKASAVDLRNDIQFTLNLTIVLAALAAGIAIAVGVYMSNSISKPIVRLKAAADQIGKGDFDAETDVSKSSDEIGQLCIHFGKMKNELRNKEQMQNDFISIASHELRTPVQPILGFAQLAASGKAKPDDALRVIVDEARRLERLTNDILDVSRLESGRVTYDMRRININDLIVDVADKFGTSPSEDLKFELKLEPEAIMDVHADSARITQVLTNIIGNAFKFTRRGAIIVESRFLKETHQAQISITDSGSGIPPDLLPKLFSKFATRNVKNENQQGTGLGLFICKAIVKAHGGEISAHNNDDGVGAKFTILLPVHTIAMKSESAGTTQVANS